MPLSEPLNIMETNFAKIDTRKLLFILEIANNHMGDLQHGLRIIREMHEATRDLPVSIAIKFQYRQLDSFIHPSFQERFDIKYVKRFNETRMLHSDFEQMLALVKSLGMLAICTGFDEASIDLIEQQGYDYLKIASCSFTDWPLLERIAKSNLPVIASVGGTALPDIDRVVSFFEHRQRKFSLMHCVAEYPTPDELLNLNQLNYLRIRYPNLEVGFSTHERPESCDPIKIAVAKGATAFERHVGVPTEKYPLNVYSSTPQQVRNWIQAALQTATISGVRDQRSEATANELRELHALRRGIFVNKSIQTGDLITMDDVFFAIPTVPEQWTANDFSKYSHFRASKPIEPLAAVTADNCQRTDQRELTNQIVSKVAEFVRQTSVPLPNKADFEISHHYGIENFYKTGAVILSFVNRTYCKKAIVMLPSQYHPEHSHGVKEETFFVLYGSMTLNLDGKQVPLKQGDSALITPGAWHSFETETGVIFEEISSTHITQDSFYRDPAISQNKNRKTFVTHWII